MRRRTPQRGPLLGLLLLALALPFAGGCAEDAGSGEDGKVRASRITKPEELIGGPSARGKIGDYLLENEKVRFIVAGKGQAWAGGIFGGSLIDADVVRWWPDFRYGKGWDSFGETFPLVNLVVANPDPAGSALAIGAEGLQLGATPPGIEVLKDGSDGDAVVRVTGRAGYMFETMKFLNKDFLLSFLTQPIGEMLGAEGILALFADKTVGDLLDSFLHVNVFAMVNRLQLEFLFYNDYILLPGKSYLTLRTTIVTAPPSDTRMAVCDQVLDCDLECEFGYALEEVDYVLEGQKAPAKAMCPVCQCAEEGEEMASLNESEDIFQIMLGDLEPWKDPAWKGGLLGGDFLFFGSEANIFSPGLGFDENRKIFENMWQGVPTLANPLTFDWITAVADNVSYGWATKNPQEKHGAACASYRLALTSLGYEQEAEVIDVLVNRLGIDADLAEARTRHVIVDRRPFPLLELETPTKNFDAWLGSPEEIPLAAIDDPEKPEEKTDTPAGDLFPEGVELTLIPATECLPSKVLIPIFSTSATAVMTHKSRSSMDVADDIPVDTRRIYTFERHLVVGDGDVGSVLETIYDLRDVAVGRVEGAVFDEQTKAPVTHASVFALKDPRADDTEPLPADYQELVARNAERFGHEGFASQMQTDRGLDPVEDGDFSGPLEPGRYLLVAFTKGRGASAPVPVTITADETATAHLLIPGEGKVEYLVRDETGATIPCRIMFVALDAAGNPLKWEGRSLVELGGSRYDHGIYAQEHSADGHGKVTLPAGRNRPVLARARRLA